MAGGPLITAPGYKPVRSWSQANQGFYARFRKWLLEGGYSVSSLTQYGIAARLAISYLDKPYWQIDLTVDMEEVNEYIICHYPNQATRQNYAKGLSKLAEFLRQRQGLPKQPKTINWSRFTQGLPEWLVDDLRAYIRHRKRGWIAEEHDRLASTTLGVVTRFLRYWCSASTPESMEMLTPVNWYDYVDHRLRDGISPVTINTEHGNLLGLLRFSKELGQPVCERMFNIERLAEGPRLPKDVPLESLHKVYAEIEADANSDHRGKRRAGILDRVWFLLMLHGGLRVGEVRRLRRGDLNLAEGRARIEQSKGLKDRIVFLTPQVVEAIERYLPLRGTIDSDHLLVNRHRPLTVTYCRERSVTLGNRCGVTFRPHQLRHSCATLLLNAGAPIVTVQTLLGHKHIDTTLTYARLYDGTIAADYYQAMAIVEDRLKLVEDSPQEKVDPAQLLALLDALSSGTLNSHQRKIVHRLKRGIQSLATSSNVYMMLESP
jgi:integrase